MKQKKVVLAILVLCMVCGFSCSRQRDKLEVFEESAVADFAVSSNARMMKSVSPTANALYADSVSTTESIQVNQERKLVYTGYIAVEVTDLETAENQCKTWCETYDGYVASSNKSERNMTITLKIPVNSFTKAMNDVALLGKVKEKNISTQDVTERFYDLTGRLTTRKILFERLQKYLKEASSMKDLLAIEKELNSVQTEIESMEGQLQRLANQIDFSTITVSLQLPHNTTNQGFQWPTFSENFTDFLVMVVSFFENFLLIALACFVIGCPLVLFIAFLYWLTFGKLGLVKKLFKKLRG